MRILGFFGYISSIYIIYRTMAENTYLSRVVRIQEERGHKVCDSGPYRCVRHPMNGAMIIFMICLPLSLGSLYACLPAAFSVVLFFIRTSMEDRTLHQELPGYREYAEKVRYKLIPRVW